MGEHTAIAWTDHTFSPWHGCSRVSPGCERCYAEAFSKRIGHGKRLPQIWGVGEERKFFGDAHWRQPLKWNAAAKKAGVRRRVFCASMADVFEVERKNLDVAARMIESRERLWNLIAATPELDWLLLTKRPENAVKLAPWGATWPANVWLGTTVEDMTRAGQRLLWLLEAPARVRFVSCEPLLEAVDLTSVELDFLKRDPHPYDPIVRLDALRGHVKGPDDTLASKVDWVIVGGESGAGARPFDVSWAEAIVEQCRAAGTACFVKQLGTQPTFGGQPVDLKHRKGENPIEWPFHLRVQEFPIVRSAA